MDAVESRAVQRNLVVHLVRLGDDAIDVLVLCVDLGSHGSSELIQAFRSFALVSTAQTFQNPLSKA